MTLSRDFATISVSMKGIKRGYPERTVMVKNKDTIKGYILRTYIVGINETKENDTSS